MPCILVAVKKVVFAVFTGLPVNTRKTYGFKGSDYFSTFNEGNLYKLVCK